MSTTERTWEGPGAAERLGILRDTKTIAIVGASNKPSRASYFVATYLLSSSKYKVYFINPAGDYATWRSTRQSSGYDVRSFEVRVRPRQPIEGFRPGMSVLFAWPQG